MSQPNDAEIVERAREQWESPGELEIGNPKDADAMAAHVSDPPGAWVRAWVWVALDEEAQP